MSSTFAVGSRDSTLRDLSHKIQALTQDFLSRQVSDAAFVSTLETYTEHCRDAIRLPTEAKVQVRNLTINQQAPFSHGSGSVNSASAKHQGGTPETLGASFDWRQYAQDSRMIKWCEEHDCNLPSKRPWRWCSRQDLGEIVGLPGSRGWPRITDGVEVIVELVGGGTYVGHIGWFEVDGDVAAANPDHRSATAKKRNSNKANKTSQANKETTKAVEGVLNDKTLDPKSMKERLLELLQ